MKYAAVAILIGALLGAAIWKSRQPKDTFVYTNENGEQTTDVTKISGSAKFKMLGPDKIPDEANSLHQQGRQLGSEGKYDLAIAKFKKASELAPTWPYPGYDAAYTLLLQGHDAEALKEYKHTDELEPAGFFTTKTAIWSLEKESAGKIPKGTYLKYLMLEDLNDSDVRRDAAKLLWTNVPAFTPALKEYAIRVKSPEEKMQLIEKALAMDVDPETRGLLMLNKASALSVTGKKDEARRLLETLKDGKTETLFTRSSASEFLKVIDR